jgi:hypothetical protein
MFCDALCKLSAAQQVTADAVSGNTFDAGNVTPKRRLGDGEKMGVAVTITAAGTNTGSAKIQIITSAAANLGSPLVVGELDLAAADLAAGKTYVVALSTGIAMLRYLGMNYDITGTVDFTVDAYLAPLSMLAPEVPTAYADAISIGA